jgi:hypothetical protein
MYGQGFKYMKIFVSQCHLGGNRKQRHKKGGGGEVHMRGKWENKKFQNGGK